MEFTERKLETFHTLGPNTSSMYRTLVIPEDIQAELKHTGALGTMAARGLAPDLPPPADPPAGLAGGPAGAVVLAVAASASSFAIPIMPTPGPNPPQQHQQAGAGDPRASSRTVRQQAALPESAAPARKRRVTTTVEEQERQRPIDPQGAHGGAASVDPPAPRTHARAARPQTEAAGAPRRKSTRVRGASI